MVEQFALLDDRFDDTDDEATEYLDRHSAFHALEEFVSHIGKAEFTAEEFERWAKYHYCLDEAHVKRVWSGLLTKAKNLKLIHSVGSAPSKNNKYTTQRWVAA